MKLDFSIPDFDSDKTQLVLIAILLLGVIGFIGSSLFQASSPSNQYVQQDALKRTTDLAASGGMPTEGSTERKQITTINLDFEVSDVQEALTDARQVTNSYNGIVESEYFNKRYSSSGRLMVRIPEENVSEFKSEVEDKWTVQSRNTDTNDVTDQYTELQLELENKRQELKKLEELMNKTDSVESLIKIQERMSELRSRIQYLENRLGDLDKRVEYTQFTLQFEEKQRFVSEFETRQTLSQAYKAIFDSIRFIVIGIGYVLPILVLFGLFKGFKRLKSRF